jgi:hypothetical protein
MEAAAAPGERLIVGSKTGALNFYDIAKFHFALFMG